MAQYISAERLKQAVDRLRQSRASGGFVNFLILKRALALADGDTVNLSTRDEQFQQAITDLTWWPADEEDQSTRPFVDVFGSLNAKNLGMKKQKYRSNGPADTLKNGAWSPVVRVETGGRAKSAGLADDYIQGLAGLALLKDEQRPMPRIGDAAAWYFRRREVDDLVNGAADDAALEQRLSEAFRQDLGLSDDEVEILFETGDADAE